MKLFYHNLPVVYLVWKPNNYCIFQLKFAYFFFQLPLHYYNQNQQFKVLFRYDFLNSLLMYQIKKVKYNLQYVRNIKKSSISDRSNKILKSNEACREYSFKKNKIIRCNTYFIIDSKTIHDWFQNLIHSSP